MTTGLVIIDVQNEYFSGGAMELVGIEQAATNCRLLLEHFRAKKLPVFNIQHISVEGIPVFVPGSWGSEIHPSVQPENDERVIRKHLPNAFRDTDLGEALKEAGVTELVICGAMTHMCVDTTTRAAFDLGYPCRVVADACATRDLQFAGRNVSAADVQASFMAALSFPFAAVVSTQEYLTQ